MPDDIEKQALEIAERLGWCPKHGGQDEDCVGRQKTRLDLTQAIADLVRQREERATENVICDFEELVFRKRKAFGR